MLKSVLILCLVLVVSLIQLGCPEGEPDGDANSFNPTGNWTLSLNSEVELKSNLLDQAMQTKTVNVYDSFDPIEEGILFLDSPTVETKIQYPCTTLEGELNESAVDLGVLKDFYDCVDLDAERRGQIQNLYVVHFLSHCTAYYSKEFRIQFIDSKTASIEVEFKREFINVPELGLSCSEALTSLQSSDLMFEMIVDSGLLKATDFNVLDQYSVLFRIDAVKN